MGLRVNFKILTLIWGKRKAWKIKSESSSYIQTTDSITDQTEFPNTHPPRVPFTFTPLGHRAPGSSSQQLLNRGWKLQPLPVTTPSTAPSRGLGGRFTRRGVALHRRKKKPQATSSQHRHVTESKFWGIQCPSAALSGGERGRARVAIPRGVRHVGGVSIPYRGWGSLYSRCRAVALSHRWWGARMGAFLWRASWRKDVWLWTLWICVMVFREAERPLERHRDASGCYLLADNREWEVGLLAGSSWNIPRGAKGKKSGTYRPS